MSDMCMSWMPTHVPSSKKCRDLKDIVKTYVEDGLKIDAIKILRERIGCTLFIAKNSIEQNKWIDLIENHYRDDGSYDGSEDGTGICTIINNFN